MNEFTLGFASLQGQSWKGHQLRGQGGVSLVSCVQ